MSLKAKILCRIGSVGLSKKEKIEHFGLIRLKQKKRFLFRLFKINKKAKQRKASIHFFFFNVYLRKID